MPKYIMSDGRAFTNYHPNCTLNKVIQDNYKIQNSHQYRAFLQQNAEELIKEFAKNESAECKICPVCKHALEYKPKN